MDFRKFLTLSKRPDIRFLYLFVFTVLLSGTISAQKKPLDSVMVKQIKMLNHMDGKYILKVGTVYLDTRKSYADSLFSLDRTVVISNGDKTIDIIYNEGYAAKDMLIPIAEDFANQGFEDFKIAKLSLDSFKIKYIMDEESDDKYTVNLGSFDGIVPLPRLMKILSVPGIRSIWDSNQKKYSYLYGVYYSQAKAKEAVLKFVNQGFRADVFRFGKGALAYVSPTSLYSNEEMSVFQKDKNDDVVVDTKAVVFRVQVGTFNGDVPASKFKGKDILVFPFGASLNKCFSGSFDNYKEAYKHKLELNKDGFKDAFIVVFQGGEKKSVGEFVTKEEYQQIVAELNGK